MQLFAVHFDAVRPEDIHVEQPPQRRGVLDVGRELFDGQRVGVQHIERFTAGGRTSRVGVQRCELGPEELLPEQLLPAGKAPPDERRILDRTRDIHGKANERLLVLRQKLLLVMHPAFAGVQHFKQRNFSCHREAPFLKR